MSPPHHSPGLAVIDEPRAVRFDPDARAYEAFRLGSDAKDRTSLQEPLTATALKEALAEATSRWSWDRGDRLGIREIAGRIDLLHIYAVRRSAHGSRGDWASNLEYARRLDHICTIDLNIVAGVDVVGVGVERDIFERRQRQRPEGARR